jgi:histidinol dehydrogenase
MKIINWNTLSETERNGYLQRPALSIDALKPSTQRIIETVRRDGDAALLSYTEQFDQVCLNSLSVSESEFAAAEKQIDKTTDQFLQTAIDRIDNYQRKCLPQETIIDTQDGIVCLRRPVAIDSVGLYVPGGDTPLISTLMMLALPAKIAGCTTRIVCTPPQANGSINPLLLVAARRCGIETIIPVGGAQAIAAMAYGTKSVPKVAKLFGPGNAWVTCAKSCVANDPNGSAIDMPAGPSEILIIADDSANPEFVAADLLSQAEHGPDSQVILVTPQQRIAEQVLAAIERQQASLPRQTIIRQSLRASVCIVVDNLDSAIAISNQYAPEHLSLQIAKPESYLDKITNAGAVFVGPWSVETMGDYINGSNHVLPTYGMANSISGLSVTDFMKSISIQQVSAEGLSQLGPTAAYLAQCEGLLAHSNAVTTRLEELTCQLQPN